MSSDCLSQGSWKTGWKRTVSSLEFRVAQSPITMDRGSWRHDMNGMVTKTRPVILTILNVCPALGPNLAAQKARFQGVDGDTENPATAECKAASWQVEIVAEILLQVGKSITVVGQWRLSRCRSRQDPPWMSRKTYETYETDGLSW